MEIRLFAERILFGNTLEDKLLPLDQYQDEHPGQALAVPPTPGRPAALALDQYHQRQRVRFAELRHFHTEKERGLVLHFFANHELLALELMALALLRFPEAPDKFRRGLVQTLRDEQEHVRLYLGRLAQVEVEFGQIPVSDFFWRAIAPSPSPLDFVARLSLTLEQANLDYARHYAAAYQHLGDGDTARILDRIYRDEIGHVKHGLVWFNRWRDPALSEWEAYRGVLQMPLTPSRAKGIGFNREGRQEAGLSEAFIDELEFYARSKGRCPSVYWFDPSCESQVIRPGFIPSQPVRQLAQDLVLLPLYLCAPDDVVLVPRRPSLEFLRSLSRAGFAIPELVEHPPGSPLAGELARRKIHALRPWGWSPQVERVAAPLRDQLSMPQSWREEWRSLYSKAWSAAALRDFLRTCEEDWLCDAQGVALGLARRVNASRTALWLILKGREVESAGLGGIPQFAAHLRGRFPAEMKGEHISRGVLCTTDPAQAQAFATLLLVGESLEECKEYFAGLPGKVGEWRKWC